MPKRKPSPDAPPPPKGYRSWLDYAVATFSSRDAQLEYMFDERYDSVPREVYKKIVASEYQALKSGRGPLPEPKRIYVVRHAQSEVDAAEEAVLDQSSPLTPLGVEQALALVALLPADSPQILTSPYRQAGETAQPYLQRLGREPTPYWHGGEFGLLDADVASKVSFSDRHALVARYWETAYPDLCMGPGAESFWRFEKRVAAFRDFMEFPIFPSGTVMFGHQMWMALLFWQLMGFSGVDDLSAFKRFHDGFPIPNGAVYELTQGAAGRWGIQIVSAGREACHP